MSRQVAKPEEPHHAPGEAPATFDPVAFDRDESDTIFLLTSLSAGSSTIITATTRLEHILKSNKVPFKSVDLATDDKAKRLWHWKGNGRRLPAIAKEGEVIGVRSIESREPLVSEWKIANGSGKDTSLIFIFFTEL